VTTLAVEIAKPARRVTPAVDRFMAKWALDVATGCWQWNAHVAGWGYGDFNRGPGLTNQPAHRWAFEHFVRPLAEGEQVHHRCENPRCVNPDHLEAMTLDEHNLRHGKAWGVNKAKKECRRGHPLAGDNLRVGRAGARMCRECERIRAAMWRRANPEKVRAMKQRARQAGL
jgi:hypothetical protein